MQVHVNHFAVLIHCSPKVMLFTIDLNGPARRARGNGEYFVNEENVAVASVPSLQSA